ncbi:MAG: hypothetical protein ACFE89_04695 [Candidatus Hodarchaeota archaeon]
MAGVIEHPLKHITDEILARSVPNEERDNLQCLFESVLLYIKLVETGALTPEERKYPSHQKMRFSQAALSSELAESLKDRIRIIHEYGIRSVSRIQEMLLIGLERSSNRLFSTIEVDILNQMAKNPMASITKLAQNLNLTRYKASRILQILEEQNGLRRVYIDNRGKFKLTTYGVVFQTHSYEESKALESWVRQTSLPFLTAFVFDVTFSHGFMAFAVPSQQRAFQLFEKRVKWLKRNFLHRVHVHRVLEKYWNIRFDLYDAKHGNWQSPPEFEDIKRIEDPGEEGLEDIAYIHYQDFRFPVHFRQIDFLLANIGITPQDTLTDIRNTLASWEFHLSKNSIWLHLRRLKAEEMITPIMYFSGGGFEEFILISILCDLPTRRRLQWLASMFPAAFTYPSEDGILIFFKRPTGWRDKIATLIRDVIKYYDIQDLLTVHQERNFGNSLDQDFFRRWNESRQFWEFTDGDI